jgi:hypothetical protein
MDIEDLSKSQLLLLMLLVNFITSIATGVLTVSLLAQTPTTVTQTVNRIVDHTIETVATGTPLATIVSAPTSVTKTVIETNDTLLPPAIAAAASRSVNIYGSTGTSSPLLAEGTFLPKARAVVTATQAVLPNDVVIVFPGGSSQKASISHVGATITIYGFADKAALPNPASPIIVDHSQLKPGQTVVALTADGSAVTGIISKIDELGVHTNLPATPAGNAAVDLSGNILGISSGATGLYFNADKITTLLNATSSPAGT